MWQILPSGGGVELAKKLPHFGIAEVLFIAAMENIPRDVHPGGIISWMSEIYMISRVSIYQLGQRVMEPEARALAEPAERVEPAGGSLIEVTEERINCKHF